MKRVVLNFKEWFGNLVLDYIDFYLVLLCSN